MADDPAVIDRFNSLLDYVATQVPDMTLNSLAIDNVDKPAFRQLAEETETRGW
ncbi:MAG: hypothetical protein HF973_01340 [Chloroflexi bacterium]|nr:hypothetical protein [Chloroflexota bacterium]